MTPAPWIAVAHDIQLRYAQLEVEGFEPDEFWKDEQERSEWFEEVADLGRALAKMILDSDADELRREQAAQIASALNRPDAPSPSEAVAAVGLDPEAVFAEEGLTLDDPQNDIIDLGWANGTCRFVQRIGGVWRTRQLS